MYLTFKHMQESKQTEKQVLSEEEKEGLKKIFLKDKMSSEEADVILGRMEIQAKLNNIFDPNQIKKSDIVQEFDIEKLEMIPPKVDFPEKLFKLADDLKKVCDGNIESKFESRKEYAEYIKTLSLIFLSILSGSDLSFRLEKSELSDDPIHNLRLIASVIDSYKEEKGYVEVQMAKNFEHFSELIRNLELVICYLEA